MEITIEELVDFIKNNWHIIAIVASERFLNMFIVPRFFDSQIKNVLHKVILAIAFLLSMFTALVDYNKLKLKANSNLFPIIKENNNFMSEQDKVNYYVPKCKQEIFDVEFWSDFTNEELEHILNGIYAYEGMCFSGGYYEVFSWYNGYIDKESFTEDMLCYNQHKNIANIITILKQRGLR